jgi:hypothetical protein
MLSKKDVAIAVLALLLIAIVAYVWVLPSWDAEQTTKHNLCMGEGMERMFKNMAGAINATASPITILGLNEDGQNETLICTSSKLIGG